MENWKKLHCHFEVSRELELELYFNQESGIGHLARVTLWISVRGHVKSTFCDCTLYSLFCLCTAVHLDTMSLFFVFRKKEFKDMKN